MRWFSILMGMAVLVVLLNAGCAAVRSGYASAPYKVTQRDGKFEVRQYPALTLVETPMQGEDGSFMRLFHYIGGQNEAKQKIAMTTPVFMERGSTNGMMSFVLPSSLPLAQAPAPAEVTVDLREMPAGRFAVLRFSGRMSIKREARYLQQLRDWVAASGFQAVGNPIYGYFDPPWTPPFFRRNEVMLRLSP